MHRRQFFGGVAGVAAAATAGCSLLSDSSDASSVLAPADEWFLTGDGDGTAGGEFSAGVVFPQRLQQDTSAAPQQEIDARITNATPRDSGLAPESIELTADVSPAGEPGPARYDVTLGDFDRGTVVESLQSAGLAEEGTAGEFQLLLRRGPEDTWFAVADGRVITAPYAQGDYDRTKDALTAVIDTGNGDRPRALDRWDAPAEVAGRLPEGGDVSLRYQEPAAERTHDVGRIDGADVVGRTWKHTGERVEYTTIFHFADGREIDDELLDSLSSTADPRTEALGQEVDGRIVETRFARGG